MTALDYIVFELIVHARSRCGAGFGNYAVGVRHAIEELLVLVDQNHRNAIVNITIREALADLDERLRQ